MRGLVRKHAGKLASVDAGTVWVPTPLVRLPPCLDADIVEDFLQAISLDRSTAIPELVH